MNRYEIFNNNRINVLPAGNNAVMQVNTKNSQAKAPSKRGLTQCSFFFCKIK
jgi:hypothetical protein